MKLLAFKINFEDILYDLLLGLMALGILKSNFFIRLLEFDTVGLVIFYYLVSICVILQYLNFFYYMIKYFPDVNVRKSYMPILVFTFVIFYSYPFWGIFWVLKDYVNSGSENLMGILGIISGFMFLVSVASIFFVNKLKNFILSFLAFAFGLPLLIILLLLAKYSGGRAIVVVGIIELLLIPFLLVFLFKSLDKTSKKIEKMIKEINGNFFLRLLFNLSIVVLCFYFEFAYNHFQGDFVSLWFSGVLFVRFAMLFTPPVRIGGILTFMFFLCLMYLV